MGNGKNKRTEEVESQNTINKKIQKTFIIKAEILVSHLLMYVK